MNEDLMENNYTTRRT